VHGTFGFNPDQDPNPFLAKTLNCSLAFNQWGLMDDGKYEIEFHLSPVRYGTYFAQCICEPDPPNAFTASSEWMRANEFGCANMDAPGVNVHFTSRSPNFTLLFMITMPSGVYIERDAHLYGSVTVTIKDASTGKILAEGTGDYSLYD